MNLQMTFIDFIQALEKRPGMYVNPDTFEGITAYLDGYQTCCLINQLEDPFDGMRELVQCRIGRQSATHWPSVIRHFFAGDDDEATIPFIFSFIHDLQRIKAEWGLDWLKSEFERMRSFKRARPMNPSWPFHT